MFDIKWFMLGMAIGLFLSVGIIYFTDVQDGCPTITGIWTKDKFEFEGAWVHVKVDNRTIDEALNVCSHEVAHEIFARECSDNITRCINELKIFTRQTPVLNENR